VSLLKQRDSAAFGRVYETHRAKIYNFLARMTGQREVAKELFQETWIKLATHAPRLADDTDLAGWLYTVARNLYRSHRRGERAQPSVVTVPTREPRGESPSPFDWATASETEAKLERGMMDLSPQHREVLLLVVVEGLAQDEVAAILGIGHDAVRQRLSRAREKLALLVLGAAPAAASSLEEDDARH
jgi:RNA polymerase sigma-70 factor (ECF subfamily)